MPNYKTTAAEASGVHYETYKKHETGDRSIDGDDARRYERAFGVPWFWLLYGEKARLTGFRPDEIALIEKYRTKGEAARQAMHAVADAFPDEREKAG